MMTIAMTIVWTVVLLFVLLGLVALILWVVAVADDVSQRWPRGGPRV